MVAGTSAAEPLATGDQEFLASAEFSAWITIEDEKAPIYGIKQDLKSISGSIESIEGKSFTVHFQDERIVKASGVVVALQLDGEQMESFHIRPDSPKHVANFKGKRISETQIRPYSFANIQLTDDADLCTAEESVVKALGSIVLTVRRATLQPHVTPNARVYTAEKSKMMHEQSKKARLSHTTGLGSAVYEPPTSACSVSYHDEPMAPYFVMNFAYRSRALLEIEELIPASEPVAGPSNSNSKKRAATGVIIIDSSDDEDENDASELLRLRAENQQLKRRAKVEPVDKKPKIERDAVPKIEKGTVIVIEDD